MQAKPHIVEVREKHDAALTAITKYRKAADYLAAAMIYLKDNILLERPLVKEDVKERLLGHWGTCPGITIVYSHLNRLVLQHNIDCLLVTGPGHGAPANLANLYIEGSLYDFYPEYSLERNGLKKLIKGFSMPGGFPSHVNAETPGSIHEGGELGYALSVAYGAVMDNPDLLVACIVGDGEAETGPTATAWHSHKFIDPKESGAVLPIVHVNGYKISNPTLYGTMSDEELYHLFSGYGYQVRFVEDMSDIDADMFSAMEWALAEIKAIQHAARTGKPLLKPKWPVLIMRTPKGLGGPKEFGGVPIEGSFRSHQVPLKDCITDPAQFKLLEAWLKSYKPEELFDLSTGTIKNEIRATCPTGDKRLGAIACARGGQKYTPLDLPDIKNFELPATARPGDYLGRNLYQLGLYLKEVVRRNQHTFRIFCPDELESNQLNAVFDVTHRNFQWPTSKFDSYIAQNDGGRVLEILSEHTCQGWMQGYTLTGRHSLFPSYEAFLGIIATMMDQYAKFMLMASRVNWRHPVPSLNYIETSTLWRQEHNGFSHQNPGFINTILNKKSSLLRVYLPPDANSLVSTLDHCFRSKNYVNLVIAGKTPLPQWLNMEDAVAHCRAGASVWEFASTNNGVDPDVVLVGCGCETTVEVMAAASLLRKDLPQLKVRVVNVTDLLVLSTEHDHPHGLNTEMFEALFTPDRPVIFNFHGYPSAIKQLIFNRNNAQRFEIRGYIEEGTTTTPFDMCVQNETSRYHIAMSALRHGSKVNQG